METEKRVMLSMFVKHHNWLKDTAKTLDITVKELLAGVLDTAMHGDTVKQYRQDAVRRQLTILENEIMEKRKEAEKLNEELSVTRAA